MSYKNKPWINSYDEGFPESLEYPDATMYELFREGLNRHENAIAISFMRFTIKYGELSGIIDKVADYLASLGMVQGDVVTICLPNIPQAVAAFYAVNKLGLVANMVHPLTPAVELKEILEFTGSEVVFILNAFMYKYTDILKSVNLKAIIIPAVTDYLQPLKKIGFNLTRGRKIKEYESSESMKSWKEIISGKYKHDDVSLKARSTEPTELDFPSASSLTCSPANSDSPTCSSENSESDSSKPQSSQPNKKPDMPVIAAPFTADDVAIYLHSGGTTGSPKTIMLTSRNMNALGIQGPYIIGVKDPIGKSMAVILPLFHGFGLCMGMHTMLVNGATCNLMPLFTSENLAMMMKKEKPDFIAAVPTLLEGIMKNKKLKNADLSFLKAIFCGGDTLTPELKRRFDKFLRERGADITVREGYGLTETVTVSCVNPQVKNKEGSVGLPLSDVLMKIVDPETGAELPPGESGEICVTGPTVMTGYLNDPEGTREAMRLHEDGRYWVHTGDLGYMDEEGFFYFVQRIKRIIKVSGIAVFPSRVEKVIMEVDGVRDVGVIGIPHPYKIQVVKAFVVPEFPLSRDRDQLTDDSAEEALKEKIILHCKSNLIKHGVPAEIELISELPRTRVGKTDYIALEEFAAENRK